MADDRLRKLFAHKKSYKEVSEAYGAAAQIARAAPAATLPLLRAALASKKHALSAATSAGAHRLHNQQLLLF